MRHRKRLIGVVIGLVVVLGVALILQLRVSSARHFTLAVSGEPGRMVTGVVTADGVTHRPRGTLPVTFDYRAKRIEYSIALVEETPDVQITVQVSIGGVPWGSCTSSGGVEGEHRILGLAGWGTVVGHIGGLTTTNAADSRR